MLVPEIKTEKMRRKTYRLVTCSTFVEKAMAPLSSTLAWKIPWTEEPGRLQSMGSLRVRHYWATSLSLFTFMIGKKWQPTPVFLPGQSQGQRSLLGCRLWDRTESYTMTWLSSSSSRRLRRACRLKGVFSSHPQRITALHVHISIFSFYSLLCQWQYHAISSVQTFVCILSCHIFSCEVCMIEGFHVSEYPETFSFLWSLIQILILFSLFFHLFLYLGYTMQHAGS